MKKILLAAAVAAALSVSAAQAGEAGVVKAIQACSADFFKAVAAEKRIPEALKVRDGDFAYLKVGKQPLDVVLFEKPFKSDGLTVTGYIVNDEIIRYFGVPDMHTHFWGLLVREDWKKAVDAMPLNWDAVDSNHRSAHANRVVRMNGDKDWRPWVRDPNYKMPDMGQIERAFHVAPYEKQTMIFCSMQSAGAPTEEILREVRPDLLFGDKEVSIREEKTEGIDDGAAKK